MSLGFYCDAITEFWVKQHWVFTISDIITCKNPVIWWVLVLGEGEGEQLIWDFYKKPYKLWIGSDVSTGKSQVWEDKGR